MDVNGLFVFLAVAGSRHGRVLNVHTGPATVPFASFVTTFQ